MSKLFEDPFLKTGKFKVLTGILIVCGAIIIVRAGYDFGQFLYQATH